MFLAGVARDEFEARKMRLRSIKSEILGEPAWDILLEMFVCWAEERQTIMKDAQVASGVPETTALRCITVLEKEGLISRSKSAGDARRVTLKLTPSGILAIGAYLFSRAPCPCPRAIWNLG